MRINDDREVFVNVDVNLDKLKGELSIFDRSSGEQLAVFNVGDIL